MERVVNGIERYALFYRGYLVPSSSLLSETIVLATIVALWLLVYVDCAVDPYAASANRRSPARADASHTSDLASVVRHSRSPAP